MIVARSAVRRDLRRWSTCSPVTSAPAAARALSGSTGTGWPGTARPLPSPAVPSSIIHTRPTPGAAASVSAAVCRWAAVSAIKARAPESVRIHSTCSADDVS